MRAEHEAVRTRRFVESLDPTRPRFDVNELGKRHADARYREGAGKTEATVATLVVVARSHGHKCDNRSCTKGYNCGW